MLKIVVVSLHTVNQGAAAANVWLSETTLLSPLCQHKAD